MDIRNATLKDIDSIHVIEREVEDKNAASKETLIARLKMFEQGFCVAQEDENIVGYIESCLWDKKDFKTFQEICDFPKNHDPNGKTLYVIFLAVQKGYRKRGIGSDLIRTLQRYASNNKIEKLQLVAGEGSLVKFYTKLGFKAIRDLPGFIPASFEKYFAGTDGVLMECIGT